MAEYAWDIGFFQDTGNVHDNSGWHPMKRYFERSILWDKINVAFKCDISGHGDRERTIIKTPVLLLLAEMLT